MILLSSKESILAQAPSRKLSLVGGPMRGVLDILFTRAPRNTAFRIEITVCLLQGNP